MRATPLLRPGASARDAFLRCLSSGGAATSTGPGATRIASSSRLVYHCVRSRTVPTSSAACRGSAMAWDAISNRIGRSSRRDVAHRHRGVVLQGQQADRLVRRSRTAEEIHPAALLAGVLIGQEGHRAAAGEHVENLIVAAVLGDDVLAGRAAEAGQKAVQVHVVQRPGHRVRRKAQHAQGVPAQLEIAHVTGDDDHRARPDQQPHERQPRRGAGCTAASSSRGSSAECGRPRSPAERGAPTFAGSSAPAPPPRGREKRVSGSRPPRSAAGGSRCRTARQAAGQSIGRCRSASPERCRSGCGRQRTRGNRRCACVACRVPSLEQVKRTILLCQECRLDPRPVWTFPDDLWCSRLGCAESWCSRLGCPECRRDACTSSGLAYSGDRPVAG